MSEKMNNQMVIKVEKEKCDKEHIYTIINIDAMSAAMQELSGNEFKLWCYIAKNQNGYQFELSSKHAMEFTGLSSSTYKRALATLKEKGYITPTEEVVGRKEKVYMFSEMASKSIDEEKPLYQNDTTPCIKLIQPLYQNDTTNITNNNTSNTTNISIEANASIDRSSFASQNYSYNQRKDEQKVVKFNPKERKPSYRKSEYKSSIFYDDTLARAKELGF